MPSGVAVRLGATLPHALHSAFSFVSARQQIPPVTLAAHVVVDVGGLLSSVWPLPHPESVAGWELPRQPGGDTRVLPHPLVHISGLALWNGGRWAAAGQPPVAGWGVNPPGCVPTSRV